MQGVSKEGFIQEIDEDEEIDMLVMGDAPTPQDVISAAPGEDLITDPPSTLNDSSTILHGNDPTTKTEPTDGSLPASGVDEPVPSTSANGASSQSTFELPASAEDMPLPKTEVSDKALDNANDFSFEGSSNKAILIKDVNDRPPLGEPWETDLASGKPIKSIVFSQWTTMLDRIEDAIVDAGIGYDRLDGSMKLDERVKAMDRLRSDPSCEVLLVSLRAGGVGLNLTAASRVFVMDPYWNPAVENQAVDRVHRLGQTRPVVTVKYISQFPFPSSMTATALTDQSFAVLDSARLDGGEDARGPGSKDQGCRHDSRSEHQSKGASRATHGGPKGTSSFLVSFCRSSKDTDPVRPWSARRSSPDRGPSLGQSLPSSSLLSTNNQLNIPYLRCSG